MFKFEENFQLTGGNSEKISLINTTQETFFVDFCRQGFGAIAREYAYPNQPISCTGPLTHLVIYDAKGEWVCTKKLVDIQ